MRTSNLQQLPPLHLSLNTLIHRIRGLTASSSSSTVCKHCVQSVDLIDLVRENFFRAGRFVGCQSSSSLGYCIEGFGSCIVQTEIRLKGLGELDRNVFWEREVIEQLLRLTDTVKHLAEEIVRAVNSSDTQICSSVSSRKIFWTFSQSWCSRSADCSRFRALFQEAKSHGEHAYRRVDIPTEHSAHVSFMEECNSSLLPHPCEDVHRLRLHPQGAFSQGTKAEQLCANQCVSEEIATCVRGGGRNKRLLDSAKMILNLAQANGTELQAFLGELEVQFSMAAKYLQKFYTTGKSYPDPSTSLRARELLNHFLQGDFSSDQAKTLYQVSQAFASKSFASPESSSHGGPQTACKRLTPESHHKTLEDLKRRLLDARGPSILGICGETGVGKTHLTQILASDSEVQDRFLGGIFWLSFGNFPNIPDLQASLFSDAFSKPSFVSVEDGLIKLKKRYAESLPVLLILDDLWDRTHIGAVKFIEQKEKGRVLVTSRRREVLEGVADMEVVVMGPMEENEAIGLFLSSADCESKDEIDFQPIAADILSDNCKAPLIVKAMAASLYKRDVQTWKRAQKFLRKGCSEYFTDSDAENLQVMKDFQQQIANDMSAKGTEKISRGLAWCFDALRFIHPLLQECFMDLAAYPEGEFVATESVETFWRYGNNMTQDEVFLCLSLLHSRSMVEFQVDTKRDVWELRQGISWRLPTKFHDFITKEVLPRNCTSCPVEQRQNQVKKQASSASNSEIDCNCFVGISQWKSLFKGQTGDYHRSGCPQGTFSSEIDTSCRPEKLTPFGTCPGNTQSTMNQSNACQTGNDQSLGMNISEERAWISNDAASRKAAKEEKEQHRVNRLFLPNLTMDQIRANSLNQFKDYCVLKLSVTRSDITALEDGFSSPGMQIALMANNRRLTSVSPSLFLDMQHLRVLDLHGCYSLKGLPRTVSSLQSLKILDLCFCSNLVTLPKSIGSLRHLYQLKLSGCVVLTHLPRSLGSLSSLEVLEMIGCKHLKFLPSTIGRLSSLSILNLHGCSSLLSLPASIQILKKLCFLDLSGCSNLEYFLSPFEKLLLFIDLQKPCSMAVPMGVWGITTIERLGLSSLKNLTYIPSSISALQQLRHICLYDCRSLEFLPEELGTLSSLQELNLGHTAVRKLPQSLGEIQSLKQLCLRGCARLLSVPDSIGHLSNLELLDLSACWDLVKVPEAFGRPGSFPVLKELNLSGCSIKTLPPLYNGSFPKLKVLKLANCSNLCTLPSNFGVLQTIEHINLEGCSSLKSLQNVGISELNRLAWLNLRNCIQLTLLPATEIASLDSLKFLDVSGCSGLSPFPEVISNCARHSSLKLFRWGALWQ